MKKFVYGILSFVILVLGGSFLSSTFSASASDNEKVIPVGTASEFVSIFSMQSTFNDANVRIELSTSLDFAGVDLSPLTQSKNIFMGTLDGKGYSVSNLTLKSSNLYYGLIPYAKNATIQNLQVKGDVEFVFDEQNVQEIYAGVLLGYGENVVIKNCELDNSITNQDGSVSYDSVTVPVYSNVNFGFLAGKLQGNPNASSQTVPANIVNCVNYYDANIIINKDANLNVGGLVGIAENCYMLCNMNYGKITYSKNSSLTSANSNSQYFGGFAGTVSGSGLNIRNNIFGGTITSYENVTGLNAKKGAIFGGATSTAVKTSNINFDYYSQEDIAPAGDGYVSTSAELGHQQTINEAFLKNTANFDQTVKSWDFKTTWQLTNSKYHLQNFQLFEYDFNSTLDRGQIIESALFCLSGKETGSSYFSVKYGTKLDIRLMLKEEYRGFFYIDETSPYILLNNDQFKGDCTLSEIITNDVVSGYVISIEANATTAGTYSFVVSQKRYDCVITISDEAKLLSEVGVRVESDNSLPSPDDLMLPFAYNSETKRVVAEKIKSDSIYSFDHWELLYKQADGEFGGEPVAFDQAYKPAVEIAFGTAPFNKEFKLVAYFTDEEAIIFDLGEEIDGNIKTITVGNEEYVGQAMQISPSRVLNIEIVTKPDYLLVTDTVTNYITELYNENPSPHPIVTKESTVNEAGETTYYFTIDLNYAKANIKNNELEFQFETIKDTSNDNSNLLWLFITIPVVVVLALGIIIFFVVRNRRGGGGRRGGTKAPKEKKTSYKDYYA